MMKGIFRAQRYPNGGEENLGPFEGSSSSNYICLVPGIVRVCKSKYITQIVLLGTCITGQTEGILFAKDVLDN